MSDNIPQGMVAILIDKKGREIANATNFDEGAHGGFTQQEAQGIRAKQRLAYAVVRKLASPLLADAIDEYTAERIMGLMRDNCGFQLMIVPIGYDVTEKK